MGARSGATAREHGFVRSMSGQGQFFCTLFLGTHRIVDLFLYPYNYIVNTDFNVECASQLAVDGQEFLRRPKRER